jgi:hypothetical protein
MRACGMRPSLIRPSPSAEAPPSSQLLPGEEFAVVEASGGWAWGYCRHDHYVGYIAATDLVEPVPTTHLVTAAEAPIYAEPDDRAALIATLPMASRLGGREQDGFLATDSGFIAFTHVREVGTLEKDAVAVAERLVGAPYLLGGRSSTGIDCSGLVQVALGLCGVRAPRDSDQQRVLGHPIGPRTKLERGDLVFFEGHVGLMHGPNNLIHATGHHGRTLIEPLDTVARRTPILERRRFPD